MPIQNLARIIRSNLRNEIKINFTKELNNLKDLKLDFFKVITIIREVNI